MHARVYVRSIYTATPQSFVYAGRALCPSLELVYNDLTRTQEQVCGESVYACMHMHSCILGICAYSCLHMFYTLLEFTLMSQSPLALKV